MSEPSLEQKTLHQPFQKTLLDRGLSLVRDRTGILQVNLGRLCNQTCRHCHLSAGPGRTHEMMDEKTVRAAVEYAVRGGFDTVDLTGGAPELNPNLELAIRLFGQVVGRVMLRANLTALGERIGRIEDGLFGLLVECKVAIVASFPALNAGQTDAQRGQGVFDRTIETLRALNQAGYGMEGSGLTLDLVSNPAGAFLPPAQATAEMRFRKQLAERYGVVFNRLYTFANVPLGRFRDWLVASGNYEAYIERLAENFNPCAVNGVMCRTLVSVDWDGYLYDCDFNIAARLPLSGKRIHVTEPAGPPEPGEPIAVGDHCYTCTAGAGFT
jgi:radical SAM/Cys-rich protein